MFIRVPSAGLLDLSGEGLGDETGGRTYVHLVGDSSVCDNNGCADPVVLEA